MVVPTVWEQWEPRPRIRSMFEHAGVVQINFNNSRQLALALSLPPSPSWFTLAVCPLRLAAFTLPVQAHPLVLHPPAKGLSMAVAHHRPPCPHWTLAAARPNAAVAI